MTDSIATLGDDIRYEPDSGLLFWKRSGQRRTTRLPIGTLNNGYLVFGYKGKKYKVHRVAWFLFHGKWPDVDIDHKNGDRADNRIQNLRVATRRQNCQNRRLKGLLPKGVSRSGRGFMARIKHKNVRYFLGQFETPEEAHAAYTLASQIYFREYSAV